MQRILGISVQILSKRFWSRKTSLLSLSLTLVLVQVFFLALAPLPLLAWALLEALVPLSFTDCYALAYDENRNELEPDHIDLSLLLLFTLHQYLTLLLN